jgi:hypothetical protein
MWDDWEDDELDDEEVLDETECLMCGDWFTRPTAPWYSRVGMIYCGSCAAEEDGAL